MSFPQIHLFIQDIGHLIDWYYEYIKNISIDDLYISECLRKNMPISKNTPINKNTHKSKNKSKI